MLSADFYLLSKGYLSKHELAGEKNIASYKMERNNTFWKEEELKVKDLQEKWFKDVVVKESKVYIVLANYNK